RDKLEATLVAPHRGTSLATTPWDHHAAIENRGLVRDALSLTADEEQRLDRDGLVVPARLAYDDYSSAYYDIHRPQIPVFVTADSILHAVYASHDALVAKLEHEELIGRLDRALGAMHCMLPSAAKDYPKEVAQDLDLYLTVARDLLMNDAVRGELGM